MSRSETLADVIRNGARRHPDHLAITAAERDVTYAQLDDASNRGAPQPGSLGVGPAPIAFLSRNCVEYFEAMFAAAKLGAVMVPLNWRLASTEVAGVVDERADAPPRQGRSTRPRRRLQRAALGDRLLLLGDVARTTSVSSSTRRFQHPSVDPERPVSHDDVMWQLYTSGTTGSPKGVMLMHRNLLDIIESLAAEWHFDPGCVVYVPYPSFHAVGTAWPVLTMYRGGTVVLRRSFDPPDFIRSVEEFGVTLTMMVPAVLQMVLNWPSVESADMSTSATSSMGRHRSRRRFWGVPSTCCRSAASTMPTDSPRRRERSTTHAVGRAPPRNRAYEVVGRVLPWVEMRVVDPATGADAAVGEVGEVWMRGPTVMKGYYGRPDQTAAVITDGGWLRTGDAGYLDDDGYLYLDGRVKDMIISGGENIYPAEVENVSSPVLACERLRWSGCPTTSGESRCWPSSSQTSGLSSNPPRSSRREAAARPLQVSQGRRAPQRAAPAQPDRQGPGTRPPRTVLGGPRRSDLLTDGVWVPMHAAVFHGPGEIRVEHLPDPVADPGSIVISVHACGICGSDLKTLRSGRLARPGQVLGHEFVGSIVEVGAGVDDLSIGELVTALPYVPCGRCARCIEGHTSLCETAFHRSIANGMPGGFAEYLHLPVWHAGNTPSSPP